MSYQTANRTKTRVPRQLREDSALDQVSSPTVVTPYVQPNMSRRQIPSTSLSGPVPGTPDQEQQSPRASRQMDMVQSLHVPSTRLASTPTFVSRSARRAAMRYTMALAKEKARASADQTRALSVPSNAQAFGSDVAQQSPMQQLEQSTTTTRETNRPESPTMIVWTVASRSARRAALRYQQSLNRQNSSEHGSSSGQVQVDFPISSSNETRKRASERFGRERTVRTKVDLTTKMGTSDDRNRSRVSPISSLLSGSAVVSQHRDISGRSLQFLSSPVASQPSSPKLDPPVNLFQQGENGADDGANAAEPSRPKQSTSPTPVVNDWLMRNIAARLSQQKRAAAPDPEPECIDLTTKHENSTDPETGESAIADNVSAVGFSEPNKDSFQFTQKTKTSAEPPSIQDGKDQKEELSVAREDSSVPQHFSIPTIRASNSSVSECNSVPAKEEENTEKEQACDHHPPEALSDTQPRDDGYVSESHDVKNISNDSTGSFSDASDSVTPKSSKATPTSGISASDGEISNEPETTALDNLGGGCVEESGGNLGLMSQPNLAWDYSMTDFGAAVSGQDVESVQKGLETLQNRIKVMQFPPEAQQNMMKALMTQRIEMEDCRWTAIHIWAGCRYDTKSSRLTVADREKDALDSLQLLLDNGADPFGVDEEGQNSLHLAMTKGLDCVVNALLEIANPDIDQFNACNRSGDSPLHLAIKNRHFSCIKLILDKCGPETLFKICGSDGNNVLALLALFTDIPYSSAIIDIRKSQTFSFLQDLLELIEKENMVDPLLHVNQKGKNAVHVAATNGCFFEVEAISKIEFGSGRSIANRCNDSAPEGPVSPYDCALETKAMIETNTPLVALRKSVPVADVFCLGATMKQRWLKNGVIPTIEFLEKYNKCVPVDIDDVLSSRPEGAKFSLAQELSPEAKEAYEKHVGRKHRKQLNSSKGPPTIWVPPMRDIDRKNAVNFKTQVCDLLKHGAIKQISAALILHPKHSCVRHASDPCARQYCLVATDNIPSGTVLAEYVGLVRRETEDSPESTYGFKLQILDDWDMEDESDTKCFSGFMLDAYLVFNEASLINDVRSDVLSSEAPEADANVVCKEMLVNKWPRMFLVSNRNIKKGEELLSDYGQAYWDRYLSSTYQRQLRQPRTKAT